MEYIANLTLHSQVTRSSAHNIDVRKQSNTSGVTEGGKSVGLYAGTVTASVILFLLLVALAIWLFRSERRMRQDSAAKTIVNNSETFTEISTFHDSNFSLSILEKLGISGVLAMSLPLILDIASLGFLSTIWTMPTAQGSNDTTIFRSSIFSATLAPHLGSRCSHQYSGVDSSSSVF
ncbi:hypothetical protein F4801DRAFT_291482 [Xylaria longipes]|nr:hypothetical protein F4801DRAFT_291482 [Xylaria longipes]